MSPYELTHAGGAIDYGYMNSDPGLVWLKRIKERCPNSVWVNPEPERSWKTGESIRMVRQLYPMYQLSIDGITEAVDALRGGLSAG